MPIIAQPNVLSEEFIPTQMIGKEVELKEALFCLSPTVWRKPIHLWLYGPAGTGKTAFANFLLQKLTHTSKIHSAYINCWEDKTFFAVLRRIINALGIQSDLADTSSTVASLRAFLQTKSAIIVLDGIDKLKEQEYLLYTLSSINNTGLVCICTDEHLFRNLDERVQSRLMPARIHFLPYAPDQLMTILKERAEQALNDSTWDLETLRTIAERAGGNARIAIQTLRRVAEFAEATGAGHIRQALKAATPDLRTGNRASILAKLGTHHQFLYEIIRANPEIRSGKLWHLYNRRCASQTIAPVARRTFTEYLRELESLRLLRSEWISVDGRTRRFWVAVG